MKLCTSCQTEVTPKIVVMPEGYIHYAKRLCPNCGKFFDWMRRPKTTKSQKEALRIIELKKQALKMLTDDFLQKYADQVIDIYAEQAEYDYVTENKFWKEDE